MSDSDTIRGKVLCYNLWFIFSISFHPDPLGTASLAGAADSSLDIYQQPQQQLLELTLLYESLLILLTFSVLVIVYSSSWVEKTSSLTPWAPRNLSGTETLAIGLWYSNM